MSNWKLVYCFSKKLSQSDDNFHSILYSLGKSIEFASKYHQLKIITDSETIDYLNEFNVEKQLFEFETFRFLDDIKIQVLPHLDDDEILIDPDVFLFDELQVDKNCDLFAERQENITDEWYVTDYKDSQKYKFSNFIKLESLNGFVTNIGLLKFFSKEFMKIYIERYKLVRSIALQDEKILENFPKYSILFGQLLLQNVIDDFQYIVSYARLNNKNKYYHLAGPQKYDIEYLKSVTQRKQNKTTI